MNTSYTSPSGDNNQKLHFFGLVELWPLVRQFKPRLIRMVILGLIVSSIDVVYPLFTRYALDHFLALKTLDTLPLFAGAFIIILLAQCVFNYINCVDCSKMELHTNRDLRNRIFSHLQKLSISFYNRYNVGYIHSRVMSDTGKIGELMSWRLMNLIWFGSYLIFAFISMMIIDMRLVLLLLPILPIALFVSIYFNKKLLFHNRSLREKNSIITSDINQGITGIRSIRVLNIPDQIRDNFFKNTDAMYGAAMKTAHFSSLFTSCIAFLTALILSFVVGGGDVLVHKGFMAVGTLSVFMSYAIGMLEPIQELVRTSANLIGTKVNIERYLKLLNTDTEVWDSPDVIKKYGDSFDPKTENWEKIAGDIEFKDIYFKYPDGDEMVLENFNLKIPRGTLVGIVGQTGAGKSTLANLVCRFFEPTKGAVLIDGRDIRERSLDWLHKNIGYVLQSPHLFSGNIRDNVRYGNLNATDEEITRCLREVSGGLLPDSLPLSLDTPTGEGGDYLSTGEKQLISIARALLSDPAILVLDEASSSIDLKTEQMLQAAIARVIKGRTTFIIAHRLSTIENADMILHVKDGKISELSTKL